MKTNTCPKCGHTYQGYPALSRVDNRTKICPDCGIREAMEDARIGSWTRREIMTRMIKERYKPGMRVRLLKMNDNQAPPVGFRVHHAASRKTRRNLFSSISEV